MIEAAENAKKVETVWDIAHKENFDRDHAAAIDENAAIERDKTRRSTVANYIDGFISDMFPPAFETDGVKVDFVDLVTRIKQAVYCFEKKGFDPQ